MNPSLGALPLIAAGAGAAGWAGLSYATDRWISPWVKAGMQAAGLMPDPQLPQAPAPVLRPPTSPQTEPKLRSWSIEDLDEASAQQQRQWEQDAQYIRQNFGVPALPAGDADAGNNTALTVALLAIAGVGLVLAIRGLTR